MLPRLFVGMRALGTIRVKRLRLSGNRSEPPHCRRAQRCWSLPQSWGMAIDSSRALSWNVLYSVRVTVRLETGSAWSQLAEREEASHQTRRARHDNSEVSLALESSGLAVGIGHLQAGPLAARIVAEQHILERRAARQPQRGRPPRAEAPNAEALPTSLEWCFISRGAIRAASAPRRGRADAPSDPSGNRAHPAPRQAC